MKRECREVEALLDRRRAGLSEPERLVIEEHLAVCSDCARLSAQLYGVLTVFDALPAELSAAQRERALGRAFEAAARPVKRGAVARSLWPWGVALAAAAALLVWLRPALELGPAPVAVRPSVPKPAAPARALAGDELAPGGERAYAHARVRATTAATLRFSPVDGTLELSRGAVHVEVDPRPHAPFRVRTPALVAEVLGTVFDVSAAGVWVSHGHVRVSAPGGALLADLHAGEHYGLPELDGVQPAAEVPEARPAPSPAGASVPASRLLARARAALARRDVAGARALVGRAEAARPRRADRAEAGTLRAECALVERDLAAALAAYLAVSDAYGDLPAGENALFAALKLAERAGDARANELRERYRARYPRGRFAADR